MSKPYLFTNVMLRTVLPTSLKFRMMLLDDTKAGVPNKSYIFPTVIFKTTVLESFSWNSLGNLHKHISLLG